MQSERIREISSGIFIFMVPNSSINCVQRGSVNFHIRSALKLGQFNDVMANQLITAVLIPKLAQQKLTTVECIITVVDLITWWR